MRVADGSRRQTALDKLLIRGLDIERADCRQISGAERWPHITAKQAFIAAIAFLPQTRFRSGLEPPIEVFIQSDVGAVYLATEVVLAQHLINVVLGMADGAADNPAVVAPFAVFAIAAKVHAHQPAVLSATHDLFGFSGQTQLLPEKSGTKLAHRRRKSLFQIKDLGERRNERESISSALKAR